MLLKICLIVAILGGGAVVAVNFLMVKPAIVAVADKRDEESKAKTEALGKLEKTQKNLNTVSNSLVTATKAIATAQTALQAANAHAKELDTQIAQVNKNYTNAVAQRDKNMLELANWNALKITPEGVVQLETNLKTITTNLAGVMQERDLWYKADLEAKKELERFRGTNNISQTVQLPAGLRGKILAVDPKFGFVVLNNGADDGVQTNGIMMISHEGQLIGKVQISGVEKTQSVANILPAWRQGEVMEDYDVLY